MKRAVELFALEVRSSRSPLVAQMWRARSEPAESFISVAAAHWEMVVTRRCGAARLTVRGPETRATAMPIPQDAEFFGIELSAGTFMPDLPPGRLVDRTLALPQVSDTSFWLADSAWELPSPDNADLFVDRLARAGLLVHDPIAAEALHGEVSRGAIERIRRAERAVDLLSKRVPPSDVARRTGYADQSHLTRSLRRLVGQTPSQIVGSEVGR
jgi:hypothetical protein